MKAKIILITKLDREYKEIEIDNISNLLDKQYLIEFIDNSNLLKEFTNDISNPTFIPSIIDINISELKTLNEQKEVLHNTLEIYINKEVHDQILVNKVKEIYKYNFSLLNDEYIKSVLESQLMKDDIKLLNELIKEEYFNIGSLRLVSKNKDKILKLINEKQNFIFTDARKQIIEINFIESLFFKESKCSFYVAFRNKKNIKIYFEEINNGEYIAYLLTSNLYEYSFKIKNIKEATLIIENLEKFNSMKFDCLPKYQIFDADVNDTIGSVLINY